MLSNSAFGGVDSAVEPGTALIARLRIALERRSGILIGVGSLVALAVIWEVFSRLEVLSPFLFPPPSALAVGLYELATTGFGSTSVYTHIVMTTQRIVLGFVGAALVGIPLGIVVGYIGFLERLVQPIVTFGRSVAAISLLPLFIAWFGIGELSKVMLIGLGAFWVIVTYTIAGVKFVDPLLIRAARSMDTPRTIIFTRVILPAALPRIFTGLKVALAVCFMIIVAAEMIGTVTGLGSLIYDARNSFRTDITMDGMFIIGLLGFGASKLLDLIERMLLPWRQGGTER